MTITRYKSVAFGLAVAGLAAGPAGAQETDTFGQTLYWGSGLIDIPVAWVAPLSGDFALNYSGKTFEVDPTQPKINYDGSINSQLTFSVALWGRIEAGVAAYSANPEQGFFGRALLLREGNLAVPGASRWLPGVAVGVRNVGPYEHIDRFGVGYRLLPPDEANNARHQPDDLHQGFDTRNTIYGVATKGFALSDIRPNWPAVDVSVSLGYGNGLFQDHGDLPESDYASNATGGLFYGAQVTFLPVRNVTLSLMAENNAWDYNVGATAIWRGLRAGLYVTELGAGGAEPSTEDPTSYVFNYRKVAFTLGWQSNIFALMRGDFLQSRAEAMERERQQLLAEIQRRQQVIAQLELELNRYEAQNLLELEQRRAAAEAELRQEREALRRLEERLRRVESQQPPPAPPRR
ncbi:MAG TPA: hypothetical protein VFZ11_05095 [Gemmatimonadaceae bacterium]